MPTVKIQDALPSGGVTANGLFDPSANVVLNTFDTTTTVADSPFNDTLIGDASYNLVGSERKPYLPIALPAYIPTLYKNVYDIQTHLKNEIGVNPTDNREYPTSYAVKRYVDTARFEFLDPSANETFQISTEIPTSFISANDVTTSGNVSPPVTVDGVSTYTTSYEFEDIEDFRDGAEKTIICHSKLGQIDATNVYKLKIQLVGTNVFLVYGRVYRTYEFIAQGEALKLFQYKHTASRKISSPLSLFDTTLHAYVNVFIVTSYQGVFSEEITP